MGSPQAFKAYCQALQALISMGVNMSVYVDCSIFDVESIGIEDGWLRIKGWQPEQGRQIVSYPLPIDYISVNCRPPHQ